MSDNSKRIAGRAASIVLVAAGWLFAGIRLVLDLIGYATVPDDALAASGLLHRFLLWTMELPWFVPWSFAFVATLWLMWVSWPRANVPHPISSEDVQRAVDAGHGLVLDGGEFDEPGDETTEREDPGASLRKRVREAIIDPNQLHVGELGVSSRDLDEEHWLEFWFRFFNATDKTLAVSNVHGFIQCAVVVDHSTPDDLKFDLPSPILRRDRSNLNEIAPHSETIIVLQQFLIPSMVGRLNDALDTNSGLQFYFDELGIMITTARDPIAATVLPLTMGTFLRKEGGVVRTGRVTRLKVQSAISESSSGA